MSFLTKRGQLINRTNDRVVIAKFSKDGLGILNLYQDSIGMFRFSFSTRDLCEVAYTHPIEGYPHGLILSPDGNRVALLIALTDLLFANDPIRV
jgi:hypothetical protein